MINKLPINLNDLLRQRTVEGERIEYKAGWNPDAIIRTLCAFANDFENLGGGYVVIGQDCDADGRPVFPPVGLPTNQLDKIQRELLAHCQLIQPPYFPVLSLEVVEGRNLIVLQAPGGQTRPYKAPEAVTASKKAWRYYIRRYSSTVEAKGDTEQELLSLAAKVPFDETDVIGAALEAPVENNNVPGLNRTDRYKSTTVAVERNARVVRESADGVDLADLVEAHTDEQHAPPDGVGRTGEPSLVYLLGPVTSGLRAGLRIIWSVVADTAGCACEYVLLNGHESTSVVWGTSSLASSKGSSPAGG